MVIRSNLRIPFVAASLLLCVAVARTQTLEPAVWPAPRPLDLTKLDRLGLRVVEGEHVTLVTDLPAAPAVDQLPEVAARAIPLLADYCSVKRNAASTWRVQAYVIGDPDKFAAAGLMPPAEHADFPHGQSMGYEFWVHDQQSDYYRRALFLHELTHSFMSTKLGGCGPGWYMEAAAELMGGHAWQADRKQLALRELPTDRRLAPFWGRVPLVRKAKGPLTIDTVMKIDNRKPLGVEAYALVWALAKFMDTHPAYRERFRKLPSLVLRRDFNQRFRRMFQQDWRQLNSEFQLFAATLEYGHNIEREAIVFAEGAELSNQPKSAWHFLVLRADRGWQPSGARVRKGEQYAYRTKGQYVIAKEPDGAAWPCQADGVTITYHAGRPLGQLLAAVDTPGGFLKPFALGASGQFTAPAEGTLYLRVNDSPAKLAENEGTLRVAIKSAASPKLPSGGR